uniref:Uncharacterized protein n=1 Tax=Loxodonta africana TaxID=9785 RepID=G3U9H3_LOXAF
CGGEHWKSCQLLVTTPESEQEVRRGQVSTRDNRGHHHFTITVTELRRRDLRGEMWRGSWRSLLGHPQSHALFSVPRNTPKIGRTTPAHLASQTTNSRPMALTSPLTRSLLCNIHFVFPTFVKMSLLGGLLCVTVWLSRTQGLP